MIRECRSRTSVRLCGLAWLLVLAGCRDEGPTLPLGGELLWQEVAIGVTVGGSTLLAVDFTGDHGAALGYGLITRDRGVEKASLDAVVYLYESGDWTEATPNDLAGGVTYVDLAIDNNGALVMAGCAPLADPGAWIYDARGDITQVVGHSGLGMTTVAGDNTFFVAGGYIPGGQLWTSRIPGQWTVDALPLTGTNDAGFDDVYVRGDTALACGFDDGADTRRVILKRTVDTDWQKVSLAGIPFGVSFESVALTDEGVAYVGGMVGAGGASPQSYLAGCLPGGDWIEYVLPDPGQIGRVNDILVAADGDIYVVCSGEVASGLATILRVGDFGVTREVTPFQGDLFQLGQAADGRIFAVGVRRTALGLESALMLERR